MSEYVPIPEEIAVAPNASEDEACAMGCLIQEPRGGIDSFEEHLPAGSLALFDPRHRLIFDEIQAAVAADGTADISVLVRRLRDGSKLNEAGGVGYLSELAGMATTTGLLQVHLKAVYEKYVARKAIGAAQNLIESAQGSEDIETTIEHAITSLHGCRNSVTSSMNGKDCALAMVKDLEWRHQHQGRLTGVATGFPTLDKMLGGLQYGEQVIIGARPSAGKSAIGANICYHACFKEEVPTLFISLEMSVQSVMRRLAASHCGIPAFNLKEGLITDAEFVKLTNFAGLLSKKPWHFHDGIRGMTSAHVGACIREHVRKHGVKLVVIDYLQKIDPNSRHEKRTYEIGGVSKALVTVARETKVAMVTAAQLNRESVRETPRPPRISDLADSGQIDRDGDVICLLHKNHENESDVKLIVAKNRDGPKAPIDLYFKEITCQFTEASKAQEPPTSYHEND